MLRKCTGAAAGTGLVMAVTGCGLIPGLGANPVEVLQQAVQETRDVSTYSAEITSSGSIGDEPEHDGTMEVLFTEDPEPTMEITDDADGSVMLARGAEFLIEDEQSGEWYRLDFSEVTEGGIQDPKAQVDQLMAGDEVEEVGDEEINGFGTTRYEGSFPIDEALEEITDSEARDMAEEMYAEAGVSEVPFSVWIGDDEGLPRRVEYEIGGYMETIDFLEFGREVNIDYPSEDQISDLEDLFDDPFGDLDVPEPDFEDLPEPDFGDLEQELEDLEQELEDLDVPNY